MTDQDAPPKKPRALVDPEDWRDGPGQKTICEYHKDGLPEGVCEQREVDDLEYFSDYWKKGGQGKLHSEYHKDGAPYVEEPSDWDGHGPVTLPPPLKPVPLPPEPAGRAAGPEAGAEKNGAGEPAGRAAGPEGGAAEKGAGGPAGRAAQRSEGGQAAPLPQIERVVDLSTFEVASYAIFRALFGRGLRVPIKVEGVVDMDLVVRDRDIILNTNQLMLEVPELAIWRLVFAYRGKPVLELGRGVKNRIRIYRWRLAMLLFRMWWRGRRAKG